MEVGGGVLLSVSMVEKPVPVYLQKAVDLPLEIVWKCAWWDRTEDGAGGKEVGFLLVEYIKFNQTTFF